MLPDKMQWPLVAFQPGWVRTQWSHFKLQTTDSKLAMSLLERAKQMHGCLVLKRKKKKMSNWSLFSVTFLLSEVVLNQKKANKSKQNKPLQGFIFSESQKEYYLTVALCWPISAIDKATWEVNLYWQEE